MTKIQNFTVEEVGGELILHKDGNIQPCAFRMPTMLPHPTIQGQAIIQQPACGTGCQMFTLHEEKAVLNCAGQHAVFLQKGKEKSGINPPGGHLIVLP
jgi:hypothetical protein